jgi:hypothetical protein
MAESFDSVEDSFRVNGVQMSKTFKINRRTRGLKQMKTCMGDVIHTSPEEIRCSDVS